MQWTPGRQGTSQGCCPQPSQTRYGPDLLGWKETWWRTMGHRGRFIVKVMMLKLGKGPFQGPGRGPSKVFTGT